MPTHVNCSSNRRKPLKQKPVPKALLFFLLAITVSFQARAQIVLTGYTLNNKGDTLAYATVKWLPVTGAPAQRYAISSIHGWFSLSLPGPAGSGIIEVSAVGYRSAYISLDSVRQTGPLTILLHPLEHPLPEVLIKSTPPIRISGDTVSFKADAFTRGNEHSIGDVLAHIPGFVLQDNGKITFNGERIDKILLEGDDLTGKNYETLVKNLSPAGIDRLEVLKNYQDPENIVSPMMRANGQVLNLRFRKDHFGKLFGSAAASEGIPLKDYSAEVQSVSLIQKLKFITVGNANSIGDIRIPPQQSDMPAPPEKEEITQVTSANNDPLAAIDDLRSSWSKDPLIADNNSRQATLNGLARPGHHVVLKTSTDFRTDSYDQQASVDKKIFTPARTLSIHEFQHIHKANTLFSNKLSLNYTDVQRNQLALVLQSDHHGYDHHRNGLLNELSVTDHVNGGHDQYIGKISFQHIFRRTALGCSIRMGYDRLAGAYSLGPALYDNLFSPGNAAASLLQREDQRFTSRTIHAFLIHRLTHHTLNFDLSYTYHSDQLFNVIENANPAAANDLAIRSRELALEGRDLIALTDKLSVMLSGGLLYFRQVLDPLLLPHGPAPMKKTVLLPGLSINYQLSRMDKFTFSVASQHTTALPRDNAPGYIINGLTTISTGNDSLRSGIGRTVQLLFSHFDLLNHRWLFFLGALLQQNPYLYLPRQYPNVYYTSSFYTPSRDYLTTATIFGRIDKFFADMHSKISPQLNLTRISTSSIVDGIKTANTAIQLKAGVDFTAGLGALDLSGGGSYSLSMQKNNGNVPATTTRTMEATLQLDWKIGSRIFLTAKTRGSRVLPPGQPAIQTISSTAGVSIRSSSQKWEWELKCTNILNQRSYTYAVVTALQTSVQQYGLFPRRLAAELRFRF